MGAQLIRLVVDDNDDDGIQLDESGAGNLSAEVLSSAVSNSSKFGIKVEQQDDGTGQLIVRNVAFSGNADGDIDATGVVVDE